MTGDAVPYITVGRIGKLNQRIPMHELGYEQEQGYARHLPDILEKRLQIFRQRSIQQMLEQIGDGKGYPCVNNRGNRADADPETIGTGERPQP